MAYSIDPRGDRNKASERAGCLVLPPVLSSSIRLRVISLEGLLLLSLSRGGEGAEGASMTPRARLQLPTVPIQAGFLDGDLVVALPSSSSVE